MTFVKLHGSILHSSVWLEDHATVKVWITMLAMADQHGVVSASVGGLAHAAVVTREECESALAAFMAPDPDSRTPDHEGRRIDKVDGGWFLFNHGQYRDRQTNAQVKGAERARRFRERRREGVTDNEVTDDNAASRDIYTDTEADQKQNSDTDKEEADKPPAPDRRSVLASLWLEGEKIRHAISGRGPRGFTTKDEQRLRKLIRHVRQREGCAADEAKALVLDHWRRIVASYDGDLRKANNFWLAAGSYDHGATQETATADAVPDDIAKMYDEMETTHA